MDLKENRKKRQNKKEKWVNEKKMKEKSRGKEFLYTVWKNNLESMPNNWVNEKM